MTGVYEIRERENRRFPKWLAVTQVGPMDFWSPSSQSEAATEQASIPAVTTLPASDEDQRAVMVRFSYPGPATATTRGTLLADGLPAGFVVEFDRAVGVWRLSGSRPDWGNGIKRSFNELIAERAGERGQ